MTTEFENRTREVLDESASRLDGRTRSRLTQARHAALAELGHPARHWWRSYVPAGAAAAVAVLAVVLWSVPMNPVKAPLTANAVEDLVMLGDAEAPDFVDDAEDPEFYEWAAGEVET